SMRTSAVLLLLSVILSAAQAHRAGRDDGNKADRVNTRGCANLTLVLDNWKYVLLTQVKDLLLHGHDAVLPAYARIQPLSDAQGDLYKEFNSLKEHLAGLTARFDGVEAFVDDVRSGRKPLLAAGARPQGRRSRVVVRKIRKPAAPPKL
uniref:Uncharacterized protein n=1 Tax=Mola mola TaxID=94237 RepID=A0A3Q3W5T3_MOLML